MTLAAQGASSAGRVALVGAGPGDPELITLRGAALLRDADVILYDELACDDLLSLASPTAELCNVGKRGHDAPTRTQEDIQRMIVGHAKAGRRVVRLKGGDPFVFGRGGEEATACAEAGIPCEVVPGVSSAVAALAYAGIPVTDRRYAASFTVVTGHKDPTEVAQATRWAELGQGADTLVVLMGMRNLASIVEQIIEGGRAGDTPAAVVMQGSLAAQRCVVAPLRDLPGEVARAGLGAPAAIVIGDVVRLRDTIAWWEQAPLFGLRVLVTRSRAQAGDMLRALRAAGAEPVVAPMIQLEPPEDPAPLDRALDALVAGGTYDAVVFASSNAVRFVCARARERGVALDQSDARIICGGPATAAAALEEGLPVHLVPRAAAGAGDAATLLGEIERALPTKGASFLLPRSQIGRDVLHDGLRAAGAEASPVTAYRTVPPEDDVQRAVADQLRTGALGVVSFTSPSTVKNLVERLEGASLEALRTAVITTVGPTTADACRAVGLEPSVVPERPGGLALVAALVAWAQENPEEVVRLRDQQDQAADQLAVSKESR